MRILGIDPGYAILGYGILDMKGNRFSVVDYGSILTDAGMEMPARLQVLYDRLTEIIEEYEVRLDECKSNLYEAQELCKQLLDMVDSSKRLNRDKLRDLIIDTWQAIDNGIDS